ncbi:MAG: hypothetical protein AAF327_23590 [Cyanobacteria bacterium P01_A01_bin.37]
MAQCAFQSLGRSLERWNGVVGFSSSVFIVLAEGLVVSLKNLWQQQRVQRQQEIVQRQQDVMLHQQDVRQQLAQLQQQRSVDAASLHQSLNSFQRDLKQQTQAYIQDLTDQRYDQSRVLFADLQNFAETLQTQTRQFLDMTTADRQLRADALFHHLTQFHTNLSISVIDLRRGLQAEIQQLQETVRTICAETQMYLSSRQQERLQEQKKLAEMLAAYVQQLQADVGTYLDQLNQLGQERAETLQRQFQDQRQHRADSMDALFEDLALFRGELRGYCRELHQMVWGEDSDSVSVLEGDVQAQVSLPTPPSVSVSSTVRSPVVVATAASPSPTVNQPSAPVTPENIEASAADVNTDNSASAARTWGNEAAVPSNPSVREDVSEVEVEIFNYLQAVDGARLIEIEHALDINRFQTVDALRSLIKQGRIIQRDRIYVIQQEAT